MRKEQRLGMRVSPDEKKKWEESAEKSNLSLSAWIASVLNAFTALQDSHNRPKP